jgi:vacuolar-type H+-ATPase subunit I/STV1
MRIRALDHRKTWTQFVLIAILAVGLCMMPCGLVVHHASTGAPSMLCAVDLPQVFQLLIAMNLLLFAISALIVIPQPPTFSLLRPPRFAFS